MAWIIDRLVGGMIKLAELKVKYEMRKAKKK
jgi:hypothetical protein